MCIESKGNIKFFNVPVGPYDLKSEVLKSMEEKYKCEDFVIKLIYHDNCSELYSYSYQNQSYTLIDEITMNYSKWVKVEDIKHAIEFLAEQDPAYYKIIANIVDSLPYKYILNEE